MKLIAIVLLLVVTATLPAQPITYVFDKHESEIAQTLSIGLFAGFTVALIFAAILAPSPSEWVIINGEYVRR